jgi:hypothetical protein
LLIRSRDKRRTPRSLARVLTQPLQPNPLINPPPVDAEVSCDVGYRPSLAKELVHEREQTLKAFGFVGATDIRPICPIVSLGHWAIGSTARCRLPLKCCSIRARRFCTR